MLDTNRSSLLSTLSSLVAPLCLGSLAKVHLWQRSLPGCKELPLASPVAS